MKYVFAFLLSINCIACKKDFLTESPSSEFITANSLEKVAGLLSDDHLMGETPVIGEISSDDYYINTGYFPSLTKVERNAHTWAADIFEGEENIADWNVPYQQVYNCNVVLERLTTLLVDSMGTRQWNEIRGAALFMRAYAFYNIAQLFADPYDEKNAAATPGIVLPTTSGIRTVPPRSGMAFSYEKIIDDLKEASGLLPVEVSATSRNMPNKPATYALLARIYLSQKKYTEALIFANSCLGIKSKLMDFNRIDTVPKFPVPALNDETLYRSWLTSANSVIVGRSMKQVIIAPALYNAYDNNDLRRTIFFMPNERAQPVFRSNYSGNSFAFSGLALDEMVLIRAECHARQGNIQKAMDDVKLLLQNRYKSGTAPELNVTTAQEALDIVLLERRKELVFRGLRWSDLRRLKEEANITLQRTINGNTYSLPPYSNRYTMPIPPDAIRGTSLTQNVRN